MDMIYKKNLLNFMFFFVSSLLCHFTIIFLDFGEVWAKWCFGGLNLGRFGGKKVVNWRFLGVI